MSEFDKVIGYKTIKNKLLQVCDMIHNKEIYKNLGAKLPRGVLLYGEQGLGKTLMAECFIDEIGLKAYSVRCNDVTDDFIGEITETFKKAKENTPSVVFLDDIDSENEMYSDTEKYLAIKYGFDEVHNSDVLVLASANDIRKLPFFLICSGRFDRNIEVCRPNSTEVGKIIEHYLKSMKISDDVNIENIAIVIYLNGTSCFVYSVPNTVVIKSQILYHNLARIN